MPHPAGITTSASVINRDISRHRSTPPRANAKLAQSHSRHHPGDRQHTRRDHRPQLDAQDIPIVVGGRRRTRRAQPQHQYDIAAHAMILPHALALLHASEYLRRPEHQHPNRRLHRDDAVRDQAPPRVQRLKVRAVVQVFVDVERDERTDEGGEGNQVEDAVDAAAEELLGGRGGGLEEEDGLGGEEEGEGVKQGMRGEERDQRVCEDASVDKSKEEEDAELGEGGSALEDMLAGGSCGGGSGWERWKPPGSTVSKRVEIGELTLEQVPPQRLLLLLYGIAGLAE